MSSSLRTMRRALKPKPGEGMTLRPGDVIATLVAIGPEGIAAALNHLLGQFPAGFTFDVLPGPLVPVDDPGEPPPGSEPQAAPERPGPSRILRPVVQAGVVGGAPIPTPKIQKMNQSFTIIAVAQGASVPDRVLPMPNPKNSPNGH